LEPGRRARALQLVAVVGSWGCNHWSHLQALATSRCCRRCCQRSQEPVSAAETSSEWLQTLLVNSAAGTDRQIRCSPCSPGWAWFRNETTELWRSYIAYHLWGVERVGEKTIFVRCTFPTIAQYAGNIWRIHIYHFGFSTTYSLAGVFGVVFLSGVMFYDQAWFRDDI
jgi:hypothetical protein